jgi:hypothetical protein
MLVGLCSPLGQKDNPMLKVDLWTQADSTYTNFRNPSLIVTKENTVEAFTKALQLVVA